MTQARLACIAVLALALAALALPALPAAAASAQQSLDVVLLIDNSGSMDWNDPDGLRWSAGQLFVDLAAPGDRIAAVTFAGDVVPLGDAQRGVLAPISDAASRERLKALLQPRTPVGATNMEGALKLATRLLLDSAGGNRPVIVFLTDGKPEPPEQRPGL